MPEVVLGTTRSPAVGGVEDAGLVARAARGDAAAFELLLQPRLDRLFRMAYAITRDESDARDATQEACVLAWRALPRLRDHARLDAWLAQIVVNSCRMLLRRRRRSSGRDVSLDDPGRPALAREPSVPHGGDRLGEADAIRRAFDRLDPGHRSLLVLHYVEGRPLPEIAKVMGSPVGTIKWRLSNARQALERALKVERQ